MSEPRAPYGELVKVPVINWQTMTNATCYEHLLPTLRAWLAARNTGDAVERHRADAQLAQALEFLRIDTDKEDAK